MAVDIFLTEQDDELLSSGTRDPLGFEVLWTNFGARAIPNLTTQSVGAINFGVVAVLQHWVDAFVKNLDNPPAVLESSEGEQVPLADGLITTAEQVLIYSILAEGDPVDDTDRLYGVSKAKSKWRGRDEGAGEVRVGPFDEESLLKRQRNMGLFGRYEGPLTELGVFDEQWDGEPTPRVTPKWQSVLDEMFGAGSSERFGAAFDGLTFVFEQLVEAGADSVAVSEFRSHLAKSAAEEMFELRTAQVLSPNISEWKSAMGVSDDVTTSQRCVWSVLKDRAALDGDVTESDRGIFQRAFDDADSTEASRPLNNVIQLEKWLAPLEAIFERLWHASSEPFTDDIIETCSRAILRSAGEIQALFRRLIRDEAISNSSDAQRRLQRLADVVEEASAASNDSVETLVRNLVEYHCDIIKERGANPWMSFEEGRAEALNQAYDPPAHDDVAEAEVAPRWGSRNYYLRELRQFRNDIVAAERGANGE